MAMIDTPRARVLLAEIHGDLSGRTDTSGLPARVLATLRCQEDAGEVLIKLIQLAIVIVFGALYALSPKTDAGTAFSPVPYVLAAYLILTLVGLAWAIRTRLPDWAVYVSIVFDISLLIALLVSFHMQYQLPSSYFLKAPTMLYVFIFIALRGLRFEARFVLAAGAISALGWLGFVVYAANFDNAGIPITRDYVDYLTGNGILLGAEFDKIITILVVTAVLALVIRQGRRLLLEAVSEGAAARDLSRFFDESVAARIRGADQQIAAGEGVKREAAILNVDIRGFTPIAASMAPDEVMCLLADYQARIVPIVQRHRGVIDKFMGDGVMATFGAAERSETFAADALACAREIIAEADRWTKQRRDSGVLPVEINVSVASGELVFGAVGGQNRLEYTVIGPAVNLSAKLEKHCKVLDARALTTAETFDKAEAQGFKKRPNVKRVRTKVDGLTGHQDVVVLNP